ncbi:LicD family protein [Fusobacterium sp. HC1336]|uniref:LicD family protein n=1 Tax=Fusobacterium sp. HC1336 TaxID=3171169 RepID=UPI003F20B9A8
MKEISNLKKIQYVEQDILDYVVEFCKENKIEYWLDWGTLLGCIRHEGFIPWDDDIDIAMPREDYDKFIELFKKKGENKKFKLVDNTIENFKFPFIKIMSLKHFSTEKNKKVGIWIDIFPFDYYSKEEIIKLETLNLYKQKINKLRKNKNFCNKILLEIFRFKRKKLYKQLNKVKNLEEKYILSYPLNLEDKIWTFDKQKVFPLREKKFNGKEYKIPNDYDYYLKKHYGEYMKLPKIEDRQTHLDIEKCFFDEQDLERIIAKYEKKIKTAVILVAGMGTRLRNLTNDEIPKPFFKINNITLIERSIDRLLSIGIKKIILVTGHLDNFFEKLKKKYPQVLTVKNENYKNTSSMGSFYCAKELIGNDDILLLEGDLIYERQALIELLKSNEKDTILLTEDKKMSDDYYYEILEGKYIGKLTFDASTIEGEYGELTGIQKLSNELCKLMFKKYEEENNLKLGYEYCIEKIAEERKISCKRVDGILWSEIDDEYQLKRVLDTIYPELLKKGER